MSNVLTVAVWQPSLGVPLAVLLSLALQFAGMAGLCLAMDRHHGQVWGGDAPARRRALLRWGGVLLIALAALPCVQAWGTAIGPVAWCGFLSAGALGVAFGLPYAPRTTVRLAAVAALGGLLLSGLVMAGVFLPAPAAAA